MESDLNIYKTADLLIQPDLGQVKIGDHCIRLGPVNMSVLVLLVKNQGQVVTRTTLFDNVWKNQLVSDDTLTRCISDLRNKLGKHSSSKKLIDTIPKKGYQWNPIHEGLDSKHPITLTTIKSVKSLKSYLNLLLAVVLGLLVLSTSTLWIANHMMRPTHIPILLIPIEVNDSKNQSAAENIDDSLRKNILKTTKIRFLSRSIVKSKHDYSVSSLSNQYGMQWAIETKIRSLPKSIKVTLSLVDTRTGLEIYSETLNSDGKQSEIDKFCLEFINELNEKLQH